MLNISSHKNKEIFREKFDLLFWEKKISSQKELEELFYTLGYTLTKTGNDIHKGAYLTLEDIHNPKKKISLYGDIYVNMLKNKATPENQKQQKEESINTLNQKFVNSYIEIAVASLFKKGIFINSCQDYRLASSPILDYEVNTSETNAYTYTKKSKAGFEVIKDTGKNVTLHKSIDIRRSAATMADIMYKKGSHKIIINSDNPLFIQTFLNRIKTNNYNIKVVSPKGKTLYTPKLQEQEPTVQKEVAKEIAQTIRTTLQTQQEQTEFDPAQTLIKLFRLNMSKRDNVAEFKEIINTLVKQGIDKHTFQALFKCCDIEIVKKGKDTQKGEYLTLLYDNKKASIFNKTLFEMFTQTPQQEQNNIFKQMLNNKEEFELHTTNNENLSKEVYNKGNLFLETDGNIIDINYEYRQQNKKERAMQDAYKKGIVYRQTNVQMTDKGSQIDVNKIEDISKGAQRIVDLLELKNQQGLFKKIYIANNEIRYAVFNEIIKRGLEIEVFGAPQQPSQPTKEVGF